MDLCHKIWFRYVEQVIVVLDKLLDVLKSLTYMQKLIQKFEKEACESDLGDSLPL